ncbi:MAG TPA: histidine ammonia-lyase, partial [Thermoanaerobaculia bacterium]|nr:histidine ammonia-lyase [Thermoanaerobaculia bacterium]
PGGESILRRMPPGATTIEIDGASLSLDDLGRVARGEAAAALAPAALERVAAGRRVVERVIARGEAVYGLNTGFGDLAMVRIPPDRLDALQERLIVSHAAGVGEPLPDAAVRAMLLLRANTLARGHSGVRPVVVERLLDLLGRDLLPVVPSRGSVGASGDLAPLAHLALPLLGRGRVRRGGEEVAAGAALADAGIEPLALAPKEGLALINGTQAMTALLALAALEARRLVRTADLVGALSTDALRGTDAAFDPRLHALRPYPGQRASAANLWRLLQGSAIRESHRVGDVRVQDPYSLRCMPQVHGAVRDLLADVEAKLAIEMNAVTDNPLVFAGAGGDDGEGGELISGGNFHGEPMALAADVLAIALAELGAISERRTEKLTNTAFSGLPPFLVEDAGVNSGFMIAQVTAAALASENKGLAHPASVDSIPTSADKEDHVSMGMGAALKLGRVVDNVRQVLAIELLAAAQGIDLLRPLASSRLLEALHAAVRRRVARWDEDREMAPDLAAAAELLAGGLDDHLAELE